jgi:hypothetical protein
MEFFLFLLCASLIVAVYLLPSIVASGREHRDVTSLTIVNIFFGWTLLGWGICLAWAFKSGVEKTTEKDSLKDSDDKYIKLEKLSNLLEKKAITEEEFIKEKSKILK